MSRTTKKKYVTSQLVHQTVERLEDGQFIAKIISSRGNNLHEVLTADEDSFLVSMPTKFRRTLWVRRGNFVILQPIEEGEKVRAEIVHVLDAENIALLVERKVWPEKFATDAETLTKGKVKAEEDEDDMFPPNESDEDEEMAEDEETTNDEDEFLNDGKEVEEASNKQK